MGFYLVGQLCAVLLGVAFVAGNNPPHTPTRNASEYRLRYRDPSGCDPENTCNYFVGIDTNRGNSSFLDFYLVGWATGWVALGLSKTHDMPSADVLGCSVAAADEASMLVVDTFNPPSAWFNVIDDSDANGTASDIVEYSTEFVDGRMRCMFSRMIEGADPIPQDLNLRQSYYLQYGLGNRGRESARIAGFTRHEETPLMSTKQYNLATDSGDIDGTGSNPPQVPTRNASEYRLRYRDPSGCDPENTCNYFVGIDTNRGNSSFLDFYFVGRATGWVALGFSKTANMFSADVVGCSIDDDKTFVLAVDTFNVGSPDKYNELDDSEKDTNGDPGDVVQYSREFVDGRITCVFSRLIEGIDPCPQDLILDKGYYLQFGVGDRGRDTAKIMRFSHHEITPTISKKQYNPASDGGEIGVKTLKERLITAHGILMLVAWPMLSFTAIFFAAWMKPALPNGQWFQVHRAFNLAGLLVGVVGFILVFIAHKDDSPPGLIQLGPTNKIGTSHFALGILIMALQITNPIISMCRCKPNGKYRWIFVLLHVVIVGYGLEILAYVNVGLGVSMFSTARTDLRDQTLLWLYLAFVVFSVVLACVLFVVFTGEAVIFKVDAVSIAPSLVKMFWQCCSNKYTELKTDRMEMEYSTSFSASKPAKNNTDRLTPAASATRKPASRDAPLRWLGLAAFLLVMVPVVLALSVLMIVKGNN